MQRNMNRRRFVRAVGASGALATVPGLTAAEQDKNSATDDDSNIVVETTTVSLEEKYTISVSEDTDTGDRYGFILREDQFSDDPDEFSTLDTREQSLFTMKDNVLNELSIGGANNEEAPSSGMFSQSQSTEFESKPFEAQNPQLWSDLQEAASKVGSDQQVQPLWSGDLEDEIEQLKDKIVNSVERLGRFYKDESSNCDANVNSNPHRHLGASIEYADGAGSIAKPATGALLGALLGGGPIGGALGAAAGVILSDLKDSDYITVSYYDVDLCTGSRGFLPRYCTPEVQNIASGYWMDDSNDGIPVMSFQGSHLENWYDINPPAEETIYV